MGAVAVFNRVLWALLAAAVVIYFGGNAWLLRSAQHEPPAAPIPVPPAAVGTVPESGPRVIPRGELFALAKKTGGKTAKAAPAPPVRTAKRPRADALHGIVRFDEFAGAFTNKGFVAEGGEFEGARIKTIAPDGVDFLLGPGSETRLSLEANPGAALPAKGELRVMKLE